jgi:hypothetical protein
VVSAIVADRDVRGLRDGGRGDRQVRVELELDRRTLVGEVRRLKLAGVDPEQLGPQREERPLLERQLVEG